MPRPLEIREEAIQEAIEARLWYAQRSPIAAELFFNELESALLTIQKSPDQWPRLTRKTRRYLLRRFPFSIIYRVLDDRVVVIAVAHARRKPGYWRGRTK